MWICWVATNFCFACVLISLAKNIMKAYFLLKIVNKKKWMCKNYHRPMTGLNVKTVKMYSDLSMDIFYLQSLLNEVPFFWQLVYKYYREHFSFFGSKREKSRMSSADKVILVDLQPASANQSLFAASLQCLFTFSIISFIICWSLCHTDAKNVSLL